MHSGARRVQEEVFCTYKHTYILYVAAVLFIWFVYKNGTTTSNNHSTHTYMPLSTWRRWKIWEIINGMKRDRKKLRCRLRKAKILLCISPWAKTCRRGWASAKNGFTDGIFISNSRSSSNSGGYDDSGTEPHPNYIFNIFIFVLSLHIIVACV